MEKESGEINDSVSVVVGVGDGETQEDIGDAQGDEILDSLRRCAHVAASAPDITGGHVAGDRLAHDPLHAFPVDILGFSEIAVPP